MDIFGALVAAYQFFVANAAVVVDLADRAGKLVVDIYALAVALSVVLAPFFQRAANAKKALTGIFKK